MLGTNTWLQGEGVLISPETCLPTLGRRARRLQPSLAPIKERPARKQWKRCRPGDTSWALAAYSGKLVPPYSTLHGPVHIVRAASNSPEVELPVNGGSSGALTKSDFPKFVQFFRQASPYIAGHRARTFVIVIPGNVTSNRTLLQSVMSDIALLHGLGVRVVVVVGIQSQIDALLLERSFTPAYVGGYRVTDRDALRVAVEAAGQVRTMCEQILSKGPAIPMIRRHTKGEREIHFEPALRVVSGNYVTAKRRGVIDGVDFGYTGDVRFVLRDDIHHQLDGGNVVLLSNLGFTAAGEVLNCNTFDVGLHAAAELGADKLFCYHLDEVAALQLPPWLPLSDAQDMLLLKLQAAVEATPQVALPAASQEPTSPATYPAYPASPRHLTQHAAAARASRLATRLASHKAEELVIDLDVWAASGYPPAVATCVIACCKGVTRSHLLDARLDGGLLLELYSRDGVGTMISADFYEGIRKAGPGDLDAIQGLLQPLEDAGVLVKRSRDEVANMLQDFTVLERENKVMGCALLLHLGPDSEGNIVAELGAFCVDSAFRGSGRGDSLLDYVEQDARQQGVQRLVLLTTRTADWFEQRDFRWIGPAYANEVLPAARRARVNPTRNSQLYVKQLEAPHDNLQEPGKRIGY
ncbi:Aspartate/glutamate/uridylate kinase [Haematococcus lacustris]